MLFTVSHSTPLFEYTPLNFKNNLRRRPFVLFWNVAPANQKSLFQGEVKAALDEVSSFGGLIYLPICLLTYLLWELFKVIQTNPSIQIDICIKAYPYIYIYICLIICVYLIRFFSGKVGVWYLLLPCFTRMRSSEVVMSETHETQGSHHLIPRNCVYQPFNVVKIHVSIV